MNYRGLYCLLGIFLGLARQAGAGKSCFSETCSAHGHSAHTCLFSAWQCSSNEYCMVESGNSPENMLDPGHVTMTCVHMHDGHHNMHWCHSQTALTCHSSVSSQSCLRCCDNAQCVRNLFHPLPSTTTTTTTTTPATTTTTTVATTASTKMAQSVGMTSAAPSGICEDKYAGDCRVGFAGRCNEQIVAEVCAKTCGKCGADCRDMYAGSCTTDFAGRCHDPTVAEVCRKTCGMCADNCEDLLAGNCSEVFPNMCHIATVHEVCRRTCHTCPPPDCKDMYYGDCAQDYGNQCHDPIVRTLCPLTCGVCTRDCRDLYKGNCSQDFPGLCLTNPTITEVCKKTCNNCDDRYSPVTTPSPTLGACLDHYKGDCATDFPGLCQDPTIQFVCQATCGTCNTSAMASHGACEDHYKGDCGKDFPNLCHNDAIRHVCPKTCGICNGTATTSAPSVSTQQPANLPNLLTPLPKHECIQCGDFTKNVPCTSTELVYDNVTTCPDPLTPFCMTDLFVDSAGNVDIFKRCVSTEKCVNQWYLQTSDKPVCLGFNPLVPTPDILCHFCCVGDGCNTNTLPPTKVQWRP